MSELDREGSPTAGTHDSDGDDSPKLPAGVIDGLDDIIDGNFASKSDVEDVLKF